jgi:hypothetical protein
MPVSDGVWAGWVNKEFTTTMQSKGKMDVTKTIALDKRNEAFNGVKRIFVADDLPIDKMKPPKTANPEKVVLKSRLKALANQLEEETLKRKELEAELAGLENGKKGAD